MWAAETKILLVEPEVIPGKVIFAMQYQEESLK